MKRVLSHGLSGNGGTAPGPCTRLRMSRTVCTAQTVASVQKFAATTRAMACLDGCALTDACGPQGRAQDQGAGYLRVCDPGAGAVAITAYACSPHCCSAPAMQDRPCEPSPASTLNVRKEPLGACAACYSNTRTEPSPVSRDACCHGPAKVRVCDSAVCAAPAQGEERSKAVRDSLVAAVREQIGAFAAPDVIHWAPGARARPPRTRPRTCPEEDG